MDPEPAAVAGDMPADQPVTDAPSTRAKALRQEMLGTALTLDEVAYILSLDRTTVAKYLREKTLYGFQIGREWLVPEDELRKYVQRLTADRRPFEGERRRVLEQGERRMHRGLIERMRADLPLVGKRQPRTESAEELRGRFDRFTGRARRVLVLAQEEAQRLDHNYIGTEHLLLGLVREGDGVAAKVLASRGVELERVRSGVEFIIGRGDTKVSGDVGLTPRAKKVIELAVDEARLMEHQYIGTEHLLLGLVREGNGIAAGVLESLDVHLEQLRADTTRLLVGVAHSRGEHDEVQPRPVPPEASGLVGDEQDARTCAACSARSPGYFLFCFNCGSKLESGDAGEPDGRE